MLFMLSTLYCTGLKEMDSEPLYISPPKAD